MKNIPYQRFSVQPYVEKFLKLTTEQTSSFIDNLERRQLSKESHVNVLFHYRLNFLANYETFQR